MLSAGPRLHSAPSKWTSRLVPRGDDAGLGWLGGSGSQRKAKETTGNPWENAGLPKETHGKMWIAWDK